MPGWDQEASPPPSPCADSAASSADEAVIVDVQPRARSTSSSSVLSLSASSSASSTSTPGASTTATAATAEGTAGAATVTSFRAALRAWARAPLGVSMWALAALCLAAALALAVVVAVGGDSGGSTDGSACCGAGDAYASSDVAEDYVYNASALHIVVAREPHTMRDVLALLAPALAAATHRTVTATSVPGRDGRDAMAYVRRRPGGDHIATIALPDLPSNRSFRDYGMDILALYAYDPVVVAAAPRYASLEQLLTEAQEAASSSSSSASLSSSSLSLSKNAVSQVSETLVASTKASAVASTMASTAKANFTSTPKMTTPARTTMATTMTTTTKTTATRRKLRMAYSAVVPCAVLLREAERVDARVRAFEWVYTEFAVDAVECVANGTCDAVCTLVSKVAHRQDAVRALGVSSAVPVGEVPDAPTFAELGFPGATRVSVTRGFAVPRAMAEDTKRALAQAVEAVSRDRTLARRLRALGLTPILYTYPETRQVWYDSWQYVHGILHPRSSLYVALIAALVALVALLVAADVVAAAVWYCQRRRRFLRELQSFEAQRTRITSPVAVVLQICSTLKPSLDPLNQRRIEQVMSLLADGSKVEMESSVFSREDNQYLAALTNLSLQARDSATGITLATPATPYTNTSAVSSSASSLPHAHTRPHKNNSRVVGDGSDADEEDEDEEDEDEDEEEEDGNGVEMQSMHSHENSRRHHHQHQHQHQQHINRDGNDGDDEGDEQEDDENEEEEEEEEEQHEAKKKGKKKKHRLFRWMARGHHKSKSSKSKSKRDSTSTSVPSYERVLASTGTRLDSWQFDYLDFARRCHGDALAVACVHFWRKFRLLESTHVTAARVYGWARRMDELYFAANPFHTAAHALDVLQAAAWFAARRETAAWAAPDDVLALLVAAVIHDAGNVARLNGFLAATYSSLAVTYNDVAVLENNSLALAYRAMADDARIDIFARLAPARRRAVRQTVIALVRATDPAEYFTLAESLRAKLDIGKLDPAASADDRLLVLKAVLRLADAAHCCRAFGVARRAAALVFEEFLQQGDEEKTLGLPVSEFMDRAHTSLDRCEVLYLESFVIPLAQTFHRYCPSADQPSLLLVANYEKWKQRAKRARMTRYRP